MIGFQNHHHQGLRLVLRTVEKPPHGDFHLEAWNLELSLCLSLSKKKKKKSKGGKGEGSRSPNNVTVYEGSTQGSKVPRFQYKTRKIRIWPAGIFHTSLRSLGARFDKVPLPFPRFQRFSVRFALLLAPFTRLPRRTLTLLPEPYRNPTDPDQKWQGGVPGGLSLEPWNLGTLNIKDFTKISGEILNISNFLTSQKRNGRKRLRSLEVARP